MPACVIVGDSNKILVVKNSWCDGVNNDADSRNCGTPPWSTIKIFFSPDKTKKANFRLRPRDVFNERKTACYFGNVLCISGKHASRKNADCEQHCRVYFIHILFPDTYKEAKLYMQKRRSVLPVNYCEEIGRTERNVRPLNEKQKRIMELKTEIKIKSERLTYLKKAVFVFNQQIDKRKVEIIDEDDLEEFEELIDDDDMEYDVENGSVPVSNADLSDNVSLIEGGRELNEQRALLPGVEPLQIDSNFSLEYSYTNDVSI